MTYTYELYAGGYRILEDGRPYIDQAGDPTKPATDGVLQPFDDDAAAQAHAEATVAALTPAA